MLFIICLISGIFVGLVYNRVIIIKYPRHEQKIGNTITIVIFIILSLLIFLTINIKVSTKRFVDDSFNKLEKYIMETNKDNEIIQNGLDISSFDGEYGEINIRINEMKQLIPTADELGVNVVIYNLIMGLAKKNFNSKFKNVDSTVKFVQSMADEDKFIKISSFIKEIKNFANMGINKVVIILSIIIVLIFLIYLIYCLMSIKYGKET
jgi:hypothetical protein